MSRPVIEIASGDRTPRRGCRGCRSAARATAWSATTSYDVGDVVLHAGAPWRALAPSRGVKPGTGLVWRNAGRWHGTSNDRITLRGNPHVTEEGP